MNYLITFRIFFYICKIQNNIDQKGGCMRKKLLLLVCIISFLQTNPFAQVQNSSEKRINMWIAPQVHTIKTETFKDIGVVTLLEIPQVILFVC